MRNIYDILKEKNFELYEKMMNNKIKNNVLIEAAKNNEKTLKYVTNEKAIYIHSKYNPLKEADIYIEQFSNIHEYEHVLFVGTGLGYHIKKIVDKYPGIEFSIYEPNLDILKSFFQMPFSKHIVSNRCHLIFSQASELDNIDAKSVLFIKKTLIIKLPFTKRIYTNTIEHELTKIVNDLKNKKRSFAIDSTFQKRWIVNSMLNFPKLIETPNILRDIDREFIKNKPAILVSAGPSLMLELDRLRYIKKHKLAYIFSVGSAINTLIENNIFPDAACTYDPSMENQFVFDKVKERDITTIPLIFGSSVGFETLENYQGPLIHMITSQDRISEKLIDNRENIEIVLDAPSIAIVTLQLLLSLGVSKVILVGQNFAYLNNKRYAEGINYEFIENKLSDNELEEIIMIDDVNGNKVASSMGYISMKNNFEYFLSQNSYTSIINTTQHGANIKGTTFKYLEKVIEEDLYIDNIIDEYWYLARPSYNLNHIENKVNLLNEMLNELPNKINEALNKLQEIEKSLDNNKLSKMELLFLDFDKSLSAIKSNDFYSSIIEPMVSVKNDILYEKSKFIKEEKNIRKKATQVLDNFGDFLKVIRSNYEFIKPIFKEFEQEMKKKGVRIND